MVEEFLNCFGSNFLSTEQKKPKPTIREGKVCWWFLGFLRRPLAVVLLVLLVLLVLVLLLHLFPPLHRRRKE